MGVSISFKNSIPALLKRLDKLNGTEVETGFFEEDRYGPENNYLPVATAAAYNEFGTRHNPERPFMTDAYSENRGRLFLARGMRSVFEAAIQGKVAAQTRLLNRLGDINAELIRVSIQQYAAMGGNSAATIAAKGRDTPLIDTGKMIESVRFQVHR